MVIIKYRCDLCNKEVAYPYGGYRLSFSGDGAIGTQFLDVESKSDTIICKSCVRGLRYGLSHLPKSSMDENPQE